MKKTKIKLGGWQRAVLEILRGLFFATYVFFLIAVLYGSSFFFTPVPFPVSEARR